MAKNETMTPITEIAKLSETSTQTNNTINKGSLVPHMESAGNKKGLLETSLSHSTAGTSKKTAGSVVKKPFKQRARNATAGSVKQHKDAVNNSAPSPPIAMREKVSGDDPVVAEKPTTLQEPAKTNTSKLSSSTSSRYSSLKLRPPTKTTTIRKCIRPT